MNAVQAGDLFSLRGATPTEWGKVCPVLATALAFLVLFHAPMVTLMRDWWSDPEAGYGLLLFPLGVYLGWERGRARVVRSRPVAGLMLLGGAVLLRYLSGLAAELYTMRVSMFAAAAALIVCTLGLRQLVHSWLPLVVLLLSIPLPAVVTGSLAFPLQLKASQLGATLLTARHVPVLLAGNIIHLPDRSLFVTEACSGLRSLTALIALGVLVGGLWLEGPLTRLVLIAAVIPVAIVLNGLRIFLTGFFVYFVSPKLGEGILHSTQGWAIFVAAFALLLLLAHALSLSERHWKRAQ